jgi:pantoate kinase
MICASLVDATTLCRQQGAVKSFEKLTLVAIPYRDSRGRGIYLTPSPNLQEVDMSTPEVKVKKQIRKILDELGVYYAMPIGTGYGNSGVPDFLVCANGKFVGIEAKAGKGKTTALQDAHLSRIRGAGGIAVVINEDNIQTLKEVLS